MLIYAHRGYHKFFPENTLGAFAAAIDLGVDGIETDIRLSADGIPVLFHDRLTPTGQPVAALRVEELTRIMGYDVPTLAEALDLNADVQWDLEIKTVDVTIATMNLLQTLSNKKRILITSFIHSVLIPFSNDLGIDIGLLLAHRPLEEEFPGEKQFAGLRTLVWDYETIDESSIRRASQSGYRNVVYGATTANEHTLISSWQIEGIITDYPGYVL